MTHPLRCWLASDCVDDSEAFTVIFHHSSALSSFNLLSPLPPLPLFFLIPSTFLSFLECFFSFHCCWFLFLCLIILWHTSSSSTASPQVNRTVYEHRIILWIKMFFFFLGHFETLTLTHFTFSKYNAQAKTETQIALTKKNVKAQTVPFKSYSYSFNQSVHNRQQNTTFCHQCHLSLMCATCLTCVDTFYRCGIY